MSQCFIIHNNGGICIALLDPNELSELDKNRTCVRCIALLGFSMLRKP